MTLGVASKLGKIHKAKVRYERTTLEVPEIVKTSASTPTPTPDFEPLAVELPGDSPINVMNLPGISPTSRSSFESGEDNYHVSPIYGSSPPTAAQEQFHHDDSRPPAPPPKHNAPPSYAMHNQDADKLLVTAPTPLQYRTASGA
jgi:hypothetical protein